MGRVSLSRVLSGGLSQSLSRASLSQRITTHAPLTHHRLSSQRAKCYPLFPQLPARDEGWWEGGFQGLWCGDGHLHLHLDRPLPPCSRLPCPEADQPGV